MSAIDSSKRNMIHLHEAALSLLTRAVACGMAGFECQAGGIE